MSSPPAGRLTGLRAMSRTIDRCEAGWQSQQQVHGFEREMDPAAFQQDASVPHAPEQVVAKQRFHVAHHVRLDHGMKAMAAVVAGDPVELEAAGIAAHGVALLQDGDPKPLALRQAIGRPGAGGAAAQDHDMGVLGSGRRKPAGDGRASGRARQ